jgi:hypothetical protein
MQDGAALMGAGSASAQGHCRVCGKLFDTQPWWVTDYPNGEHTLCRDWETHPFPFTRHLVLLRRIWPRVEPEARVDIRRVGVFLKELSTHWPRGGGQCVMDALGELRKLRLALSNTTVERKLLSQL